MPGRACEATTSSDGPRESSLLLRGGTAGSGGKEREGGSAPREPSSPREGRPGTQAGRQAGGRKEKERGGERRRDPDPSPPRQAAPDLARQLVPQRPGLRGVHAWDNVAGEGCRHDLGDRRGPGSKVRARHTRTTHTAVVGKDDAAEIAGNREELRAARGNGVSRLPATVLDLPTKDRRVGGPY